MTHIIESRANSSVGTDITRYLWECQHYLDNSFVVWIVKTLAIYE